MTPATGANCLLFTSQPDVNFHAGTAFAIVRAQGVRPGKRDFLVVPSARR